MMLRIARVALATVVTVIATVGVMTAAPVVAEIGRAAAVPQPNVDAGTWIRSGYKNGPVALPGTMAPIAILPLPAGNYSVVAKLWLWNNENHVRLSNCELRLGDSWDTVQEETPAIGHELIVLTVVGTLSAPGGAVLKCFDQTTGQVEANYIKITATRASTLQNLLLK
jgi:hypothetical protein